MKRQKVAINPALKSMLVKESGLESNSVHDQIETLKQKKNQELRDYIMVCVHRLDGPNHVEERSSKMSETHALMCRTLDHWGS